MQSGTKYTGVIGTGSFGLAVARLLALNTEVILFGRQASIVEDINSKHIHRGVELDRKIRATNNMEEVCSHCQVIFPAVPSENFRQMVREFSPFLRPSHYLIHCTKGFDVQLNLDEIAPEEISREDIFTMSEVILAESNVMRVGCMSGPNLAKEIIAGQPTATLIASEFTEVIEKGQDLLNSRQFFVFGSHDLKGAEIAGVFKNVIALGSGILAGKGFGKNIQAMLITRGLHEMINFGKSLGADASSFLGTAGIGDLIATATSEHSRNFSLGKKIGQGQSLASILEEMDEVAEGVRTLKIATLLSKRYDIAVPITTMLYRILFEGHSFDEAMSYLMRYPYARDVDFL